MAGALLLAGCGDGGDSGDGDTVPKAATGTVEQLAGKAGCPEPHIQIDAEELRQGQCGKGDGRYVVTTFLSHQGQQDWLSEAEAYGGSYLVGPKWVIVGDEDLLRNFRGKLGGDLAAGASHGGDSGDDGGEHDGGKHDGGDGGDGGHGKGHGGDHG
ncbi:hypothetical protein HCK00_03850 [Streptomyces sp. PLAI1-29]|uniref:Lipoprotein n=2 Tax=Streptomyces zingiberis TaxID=2053010 RepID=A0ABX1BTB4_9ACTN|nr:hypothetical protein [Streptomyces zingiberis]